MDLCTRCQNEIPLDWTHCPHCGDGLQCPNVRLADQATERAALDQRYQVALADAASRGCDAIVRDFEQAAATSHAAMGSTLQKLMPVVTRDRDVFATFHQLAELRFLRESSPGGPDWNKLRPHAEIEILGSDKHIDQLHYAALSRTVAHCPITVR